MECRVHRLPETLPSRSRSYVDHTCVAALSSSHAVSTGRLSGPEDMR
jgi:hypothetical protein